MASLAGGEDVTTAFTATRGSANIASMIRRDAQMSFDARSYRADDGVPSFPDDKPIIIFDGKCAMCSAFARFVLLRDRGQFRFLAAQSDLGSALYRHYGLDSTEYETNILIEDGVAKFKSESSIRIFERLGFPWSLAAALRWLPISTRERIYECVARNRLRWFGARETCYAPGPGEADRFLR